MTIAKFNEGSLLAAGMDRQTVAVLRHLLQQVGPEVGAQTLPQVSVQTEQIPAIVKSISVLDLRASLVADVVSSAATDAPILALTIPPGYLKAGSVVSARVIGTTSNGTTPGTLNIWLTVNGVRAMTHKFTTPDVVGADKGFSADFTLTVRDGAVQVGGLLALAYNAPTVLPAVASLAASVAAGAVIGLGMHWSAAQAGNVATAKLAFLSVDKL